MSGTHSPSPAPPPPPPIPDVHVGATNPPINDFSLARAIGPAARELLGEPTEEKTTELRYGKRGSLCIDLAKGAFCDHEAGGEGGGCLAFVMRYGGLDKQGAIGWLQERGYIPRREQAAKSKIVATYDYVDVHGKLLFQVCRFVPKDFRQRRPDGNGGWNWKMVGVERVIYHLPGVTAAVTVGIPVYIVEGEKAADALTTIGAVATCSPGGANKWRSQYNPVFTDADVVILPDNDSAGEKHAADVLEHLQDVARTMRVCKLPGLPAKGDAADWVAAGGTAERLAALVDATPIHEARVRAEYSGDGHADPRDSAADDPPHEHGPQLARQLPAIFCKAGKLHLLADQAEGALIQTGAEIFQRADSLVRVGFMELAASDRRTTQAAGLYRIDGPALMEELARVARWERFDARSGKIVVIDPPTKVVDVLAGRKGRWRLRSVLGVITAPTLRPDGSILDTPGYDAATRLYYAPDGSMVMPPVKTSPTEDDARAALGVFTDLFVEFPFVTKQDQAVGLSLPISAVVRGALGMVPVHAFTAPTPGSGKSFIADLTSTITSGRWCPVIAPGSSQEELEKRLGAMVLAGHAIISLDNASTEISGDALCQISERPIVRIRILGKSETPECEFRGILIANGNNLVISGDMVRRTLLGCLDSGLERPEERKFSGNPVKLILADRGKYISAAITIVRAYLEAGSPGKLSPLASFAEWSDLVRCALVWLGCTDPVATMLKIRDVDPVLTNLTSVLSAWVVAFGKDQTNAKTAQQVAATFINGFNPEGEDGEALTNLRAALTPVASDRGGIIDANKLGKWLRGSKGRPASGLKFDSKQARGGVAGWFVV